MTCRISNGIHDARLLNTTMLALLLTHEHLRIHDKLGAIAFGNAVGPILPVDIGIVLAL